MSCPTCESWAQTTDGPCPRCSGPDRFRLDDVGIAPLDAPEPQPRRVWEQNTADVEFATTDREDR